MTWPLAGNYGVPSRESMDRLLKDVPAHLEAAETHSAGLVIASYARENVLHYLSASSF